MYGSFRENIYWEMVIGVYDQFSQPNNGKKYKINIAWICKRLSSNTKISRISTKATASSMKVNLFEVNNGTYTT